MFTPQDVINTYRAKNLKPVFMRFGVVEGWGDSAVFETWADRCTCAIGALAAGCEVRGANSTIEWAEREHPGLHAWAFADGFDARPFNYVGDTAEESYELGRQCRLAVLEAFPETEAG